MLKTLLKKQLLELNRNFFYDRKKDKGRSKVTSALLIAAYAFLMVFVVGAMFAALSFSMCGALLGAGMGWLYFAILSMLAIAFGVFGSVFNTFSGLYQAKDNDLLLSLPIPVRYIMITRLLGVYLMGLMFSAVVIVPAIVVYFIMTPVTAAVVIGSIALILMVSVIVLILSCALGWVVAKINRRLKNKSFITVVISLAFLSAYYILYFNGTKLLQSLIANMQTVGMKIKGAAYPLYLLGRAGEGNLAALLIMSASVLALLALTCFVLSRSFINIATASGGAVKIKYKDTAVRTKSAYGALLGKEFRRFTSSPNYMLNCGLGTLFITAAAVLLLVKGEWLRGTLQDVFGNTETASVLLAGGICMLASMNDMTAPSVSLEGKSLWIVRSLPVTAWQVLKAKLALQLLLTGIPVLLCGVCGIVALRPSFGIGMLFVLLPMLYVLLSACFGLFVNLKKPNLTWSNEIIPIKQSMGVVLVLFGGWGYTILLIGIFLLGGYMLGVTAYLAIAAAITALASALLYHWLRKRGTVEFEAL